MAVRLLMGKRQKKQNGYRLQEYSNGDGSGGYHDDEYSEDEDEVFAEDLNGDGVAGLSKPLMHPRRDRTKVKSRTPDCQCGTLCRPVLYFLLLVTVLGALVSFLLYALNKHKHAQGLHQSPGGLQGQDGSRAQPGASLHDELSDLIGCDTLEVEDVWVQAFPKLITESAFRMVDVNKDGVLDVIMGFATGVDGINIPRVVCDIYFNGSFPCYGGILALEGLTGRELWRHYSFHELFALNCNVDLDGDGVLDCLGGGRAAAFDAVSGRTGKLLWRFQEGDALRRFSNVYTPQYIPDMDHDGVPDVLAVHGGDPTAKPHSETREAGRVLLMSGRTGKIIRWMGVPDAQESYYSPQIYWQLDGTQVVLFGTGGETHGGSLWVITLEHLKQGRTDMARAIYTDEFKGVMTPPVLMDLTKDGVVDIVINPFNSTVLAIDGRNFSVLWNRTFPMSESYNTPAAGYFNADDTPDFLVMASYGPGYPVYYHAETTVLDGRTGQPLLDKPVKVSVGAQASPLTVSLEGRGHDLFIYWVADCLGHEGEGGEFHFVEGTNVHEQSRSDFCKLRYKSKLFSKLMAVSRALPAPGRTIYFSEERKTVEHAKWINTTTEAVLYLHTHPDWVREQIDDIGGEESKQPTTKEDFYSQDELAARENHPHSPGAKKGPSLQPSRGSYKPQYPPAQQRRQQQQQQQQQQHQQPQQPQAPGQERPLRPSPYEAYDPYTRSRYANEDDTPVYPARDGIDSREDVASGGRYGYPYSLDQQPRDYSGYLPTDDGPYLPQRQEQRRGYDRDSYEPYNNFFQKRNRGPDANPNHPKTADILNNHQHKSADGLNSHLQSADSLNRHQDTADSRNSHQQTSADSLDSHHQKADSRKSHQQKSADGLKSNHQSADSLNSHQETADSRNSHHHQNTADGTHVDPRRALKQNIMSRHTADGKTAESKPEGATRKRNPSSKSAHTPQFMRRKRPDVGFNDDTVLSQKNLRDSDANPDDNIPKRSRRDVRFNDDTVSLQNNQGYDANPDNDNIQQRHRRHVLDSRHDEDILNRNLRDVIRNSGKDDVTERRHRQRRHAEDSRPVDNTLNQNLRDLLHSKDDVAKRNRRHAMDDILIQNLRDSILNSDDDDVTNGQSHHQQRQRRHVGPHDDNGLQRLLSTGTLAPTTLPPDHPDHNRTIDVVFATYWFFPARTKAILPEDQACIDKAMGDEAQRFQPENKYYGMDHDAYGHTVEEECLSQSHHQLSDDGIYQSQGLYNAFNINMGQMTVYRMRLKLTCSQTSDNSTSNARCATVLPYNKQHWPAYMGRNGDSHWLKDT